MALRWLTAGLLATALFTGCTSAAPRWTSTRAAAPDPTRWERAACRIEEYPVEIDARAVARARYEDLRAAKEGTPAPKATERIAREREAFESRCAVWRTELAHL